MSTEYRTQRRHLKWGTLWSDETLEFSIWENTHEAMYPRSILCTISCPMGMRNWNLRLSAKNQLLGDIRMNYFLSVILKGQKIQFRGEFLNYSYMSLLFTLKDGPTFQLCLILSQILTIYLCRGGKYFHEYVNCGCWSELLCVQISFALRDSPYLWSKCRCSPQGDQTLLAFKAPSDASAITEPKVPLPYPLDPKGKVSKPTLIEGSTMLYPSLSDFVHVPQGQHPSKEVDGEFGPTHVQEFSSLSDLK